MSETIITVYKEPQPNNRLTSFYSTVKTNFKTTHTRLYKNNQWSGKLSVNYAKTSLAFNILQYKPKVQGLTLSPWLPCEETYSAQNPVMQHTEAGDMTIDQHV